ncbi:MAG: hypothetical protein RL434_2085, partial [Pseudomonadota bacterium]
DGAQSLEEVRAQVLRTLGVRVGGADAMDAFETRRARHAENGHV